jgi:hypothetical protein
VAGEDSLRFELQQAAQVAQVRFEVLWLLDVGDGVLDRVAGEEQPRLRVPEDCGVVAVNELAVPSASAPSSIQFGRGAKR